MDKYREIFESFNPSVTKKKDKFGNYYNSDVHDLWIGFKNWYSKKNELSDYSLTKEYFSELVEMKSNAEDRLIEINEKIRTFKLAFYEKNIGLKSGALVRLKRNGKVATVDRIRINQSLNDFEFLKRNKKPWVYARVHKKNGEPGTVTRLIFSDYEIIKDEKQ